MKIQVNKPRVVGAALREIGASEFRCNTDELEFEVKFTNYGASFYDPSLLKFLVEELTTLFERQAPKDVLSAARLLDCTDVEKATEMWGGLMLQVRQVKESLSLLHKQVRELICEKMQLNDDHYELLAEILDGYYKYKQEVSQ